MVDIHLNKMGVSELFAAELIFICYKKKKK